jgi:NADH-quinone oxidoreductase subunit K
MIHLVGPVALAAALVGTGVYGLLIRRNAVLVLIGAELILNAANVLLVTANSLPAGGLAALANGGFAANGPANGSPGGAAGATVAGADPLLPGQVMTVFVVTIAAAEIGLALAVILLLYRRRETSDLAGVRELGEASATFTIPDAAGEWPAAVPPSGSTGVVAAVVGNGAGGADGDGNGTCGREKAGAGRAGESTRVPGQRSEVRQQ